MKALVLFIPVVFSCAALEREEVISELIRTTILTPQTVQVLSRAAAEKHCEQEENKGCTIKQAESHVRSFITSDSFLRKFSSYFDEFSDNELEHILDLQKSDEIMKFKKQEWACGKDLMQDILELRWEH